MNKNIDFIDELSNMLPNKNVMRAKAFADKEIFAIRLSELRKRMGIKQDEMQSFTQSSISKLEARDDMKLSTLIEYISELGLGIEIKVYPKEQHTIINEITLIKI